MARSRCHMRSLRHVRLAGRTACLALAAVPGGSAAAACGGTAQRRRGRAGHQSRSIRPPPAASPARSRSRARRRRPADQRWSPIPYCEKQAARHDRDRRRRRADGALAERLRLREGRPRQPEVSRCRRRRSCSTRRAAATRRTSSASRSARRSRSSTATTTLHNIHALPRDRTGSSTWRSRCRASSTRTCSAPQK